MKYRKELKVGDLVYYQPSEINSYADGTKQLGVVIEILKDRLPLCINFPEKDYFQYEYRILWIDTGYKSVLLEFNLRKLEIKEENT